MEEIGNEELNLLDLIVSNLKLIHKFSSRKIKQ